MSLTNQSAELRRYEKDGAVHIRDIVLKDVRFNYTYLNRPRPTEHGGNGTQYETLIYIENEETWKLLQEYFNEVYEAAVTGTWRGRRPNIAQMNTPFATIQLDDQGNPKKFEENAIVGVKTRTGQAPKLYLRLPGEGLREATEDDIEEFYSGMIGEAVVSFWAYPKQGEIPRDGIKAYINAVCKTDHGDPVFRVDNNYNYVEAFGGTGDNEDTNVTAFGGTAATPTTPKTPTAPAAPAQTTLADLMKPNPTTPAATTQVETPTQKTTLNDLLKKA